MSGNHATRVLVAEHDPAVAEVVVRYLERDGHQVECVSDGAEALDRVLADPPDLLILDVVLPGLDSLQVCRTLRDRLPVPVILIVSSAEETERFAKTGADDYVTKPFSPRELALRVRGVLRRARGVVGDTDERDVPRGAASGRQAVGAGVGPAARSVRKPTARTLPAAETSVLRDRDLVVDPDTRQAWLAGEKLALTAREFDLLAHLLRNPRQAFSRAELLKQVWGWSFGDSSTVTVHVRRLREKIETDPADPRRIVTVWGIGYRYEPLP